MRPRSFVFLLALASAACGSDENNDFPETLCEPSPVPCEDDIILDLVLQPTPAPGLIANTADGDGWLSEVDATAGGFGANPPDAFVYGVFTDSGLRKIGIDDETALTDDGWDIALRRYIMRINSGDSGQACVGAALMPGGTDFDTLASVSDTAVYRTDDFYTASCDLINDGSGLTDSPATALSGYWSYPTCVKMTGNVYLLRTSAGRRLKLTVTHYYYPAVQDECQTTDSITTIPSGSGNIGLRWAFLD